MRRGQNASSRIYNLVKALADSGACRADDAEDDDLGIELSMRKVKERVIAKGFTEDQWMSALEEYTTLDVSFALFLPIGLITMNANCFCNRSGKLLAAARDWSSLLAAMSRRTTWMSDQLEEKGNMMCFNISVRG